MRILLYLAGTLLWLALVYTLTVALVRAAKTRTVRIALLHYSWQKQPAHFISAVLVLAVFWLGLVGWWLNGILNLFEKITHG